MKTLPLQLPVRSKRAFPRVRAYRLLSVTIVVAMALLAGYVLLLSHEEQAMEDYYSHLRQTDAGLYLSKVMQARGFRAYLKEYLSIHDYSRPVAEVPSFLMGRWALFERPKRVSDDFIPDSCHSGLEIEDGRLKVFGDGAVSYPARYTMDGTTVTAHLKSADDASIDVVGYGSHLHHIKVMLPGSEQPRYGYMCR